MVFIFNAVFFHHRFYHFHLIMTIKIGDKAILIDIDGNVAGFVSKHRVEVPVGSLVGETNARVAGLLIQPSAEQVKLLVEATTIKLDAKLGGHI